MMLRSRREPVFDEAPDLSEQGNLKLMDGLSDAEYQDALLLAPYTKGVMIVTGDPGSGKDLFGNTISYKFKRYFGKEVLRDEPPRKLFGHYTPFDMSTINEDLELMHEARQELEDIANDNRATNKAKFTKMNNIARDWLEEYGEQTLRDKVMYITEFSSWMYNRAAMTAINVFMGQILRRWRHYDLLVIGTTQLKSELDKRTCLPYVSHEVRCSWQGNNIGKYRIFGVRSVTAQGVINVARSPFTYRIDGNAPRDCLGGLRYYDLYNSKSSR